MSRIDERENNQLRDIEIIRNYTKYADGSVLISYGDTKVICTAKIEDRVPQFIKNTGQGWITAEYSMIPMATESRNQRPSFRKVDARNLEIQRLIGRALRSVVDLSKLGERTIFIDCDVIQADGGTRTASITGSFVAMADAIYKLYKSGELKKIPINNFVSAVSVGVIEGELMLDLCYEEDSRAQVDMNVIMTDDSRFIEIQGTGEESPFSRSELGGLIDLAGEGNEDIIRIQKEALGEIAIEILGMDYEKEVVVATSNKGKLKEIKEILKDTGINVLSLEDVGLENEEIIEDGWTFEHNALIKARHISKLTGKIAMGDDSGLEVDALDGKPGIFSARYSGEGATDESNRKKLLEELEGTKEDDRTARFVCAIGVHFPDGKEFTVRGECGGLITKEEYGENGFGYDSLFYVKEFDKTFAEVTADEKNSISHRGRALDKFKEEIRARLKIR